MATIISENRKQIRDPMIVKFSMQITEDAQITSFTPTSDYKSWDNTLSNVPWRMRVLADLQDEGFLLDGTAEWYEEKSPSARNKKLGLRSNEGEPVTLQITGNKVINNITVKTEGVATIRVGSTNYTATGLDYIPVRSRTFTMQFIPEHVHGRAFIDYIIPGAIFDINNSNLISATLALRTNLDPFSTELEASEIEIQMYYPNDLGDMFKYVNTDWPVTYTAGYTNQMSRARKFYLSEACTWRDNVLTIKAADSVLKLGQSFKAGDLSFMSNDHLSNSTVYFMFLQLLDKIKELTGSNVQRPSGPKLEGFNQSGLGYRKEGTYRGFLQYLMNLTFNLSEGNRFHYVDAGIPKFFVGDKVINRWTVKEEDLANITISKSQNIAKIVSPDPETYYDRIYRKGEQTVTEAFESDAGAIFDLDFNGTEQYLSAAWDANRGPISEASAELISWTPNGATYKARWQTDNMKAVYWPLIPSGGATEYVNPNNMPGEVITYESPINGTYISFGESLFSPKNLFGTNRDTIQFDFKGDPRWQPRDLLTIERLDGTTMKTRIASIELKHEGGGTYATVVAQMSNQY